MTMRETAIQTASGLSIDDFATDRTISIDETDGVLSSHFKFDCDDGLRFASITELVAHIALLPYGSFPDECETLKGMTHDDWHSLLAAVLALSSDDRFILVHGKNCKITGDL